MTSVVYVVLLLLLFGRGDVYSMWECKYTERLLTERLILALEVSATNVFVMRWRGAPKAYGSAAVCYVVIIRACLLRGWLLRVKIALTLFARASFVFDKLYIFLIFFTFHGVSKSLRNF